MALLSSVLSIMHGELYQAGRESLIWLGRWAHDVNAAEMKDALSEWSSAFNGLSVISNRETPPHRDGNSLSEAYDLLVTVGPYKDGWLDLHTLGVRLKYGSGTICALSGRTVRHSVPACDGDRLCLAFYMRNNIHRFISVNNTNWSTYDAVCHK